MTQRHTTLNRVVLHAVLVAYALLSLYPLLYIVSLSLKTNQEIFVSNPLGVPRSLEIANYKRALTDYDVARYFTNSVIVTMLGILISTSLGLSLAYATARMRWRRRWIIGPLLMVVAVGLFIPVQTILIPLLILIRNLGIANTHLALALPYGALKISLSVIIYHGFLRTIPFEMEESAAMEGCGTFQTFVRIIVPLVRPVIATVTIFLFVQNWNEFILALFLISKQALFTLPLGILQFQGQFSSDWGAMGAVLTISSIPTLAIYLLFSRHVENAFTSTVKG